MDNKMRQLNQNGKEFWTGDQEKAPQMEVLLHHYTFGKPRFEVEVAPPPPRMDQACVVE